MKIHQQDFLSDVSNQIRTGLGSISSMADGVLRNLGDDSKIISSITSLTCTSDHLELLINDVLDYLNITSGKVELEQSACRIHEVIEAVSNVLLPISEKSRISFHVLVGESIPEYVSIDKFKFINTVVKLYQCAIKKIQDGSANVSIWKDQNNIVVKIDSQGYQDIDFTERNPVQIDQENAGNINEFIASSYIEMMGGTLSKIASSGTVYEYVFTIPMTIAIVDDEAYKSFDGLHILVVDDIERNRLLMKEILEEEGVKLSYAENGFQAIEIVKSHPKKFDVILMDIQMPDMDGYTATRLIHEVDHNIPVIGITAHSTPKDIEKAMSNGMSDFITKPLKIRELMDSIKRHI